MRGGVAAATLADIYNAADIKLLASKGEGFGIPVIESQACGTPVVVTDFSAQPELVRWGRVVPVIERIREPFLDSYWARPSTEGITAALQDLYDEEQSGGGCWPLERRRAVSAQIHGEYGWDQVFARHWAPLVQGLVSDKAHSYSP